MEGVGRFVGMVDAGTRNIVITFCGGGKNMFEVSRLLLAWRDAALLISGVVDMLYLGLLRRGGGKGVERRYCVSAHVTISSPP